MSSILINDLPIGKSKQLMNNVLQNALNENIVIRITCVESLSVIVEEVET